MSKPFYEVYNPHAYRARTYDHAKRAGNMLFVAGQVARDAENNVIAPGDARAQAVAIYDYLNSILAAAGADWSHVVKINTFLVDRADSAAVTEVRLAATGDQRPPHTGLIIAGLGDPDVRLEVEIIAVLPPEG